MPFLNRFQGHGQPEDSNGSESESPSHDAGSGSGTDDEGSQSSGSSSSPDDRSRELLVKLKRRAQTEKARAAALVARAKRRIEKVTPSAPPPHPAALYQADLQPRPEVNKPGGSNWDRAFRRVRVLISWFQSWCSCMEQFLTGTVADHSLLISVVDDTNVVLSERIDAHWRRSRVVTVMNMVQSLVVAYNESSPGVEPCRCHRTFLAHVPPVCVPKTDAPTLVAELQSWLVTFKGKVSKRFEAFGISPSRFSSIPIQATVFCWDSLKTNIAMLKTLREQVFLHHQSEGFSTLHPVLANICLLHQCALSRKPLVYHYPGCWSSIVRLSHLFETSSFRQHFRMALIAIVCKSFKVVNVVRLPEEAKEWRQQRNRICNVVTSNASYSLKRQRLQMQLMIHDNGDPMSRSITHWCTGSCCQGTTREERANYALLQICRYYVLLYAHGFPVPLLYRWVHCHKALEFCSEPRLRH